MLSAPVIKQQLIGALKPKFRLSPDQHFVDWSQVPSRESFEALGQQIKASVPLDRLSEYESDLIEGFNNVCVPFEQAVSAVRENTALAEHVLLAIGKAEWSAVKWNDQSIASKKTLLNTCELVFTAAEDRDAFAASQTALQDNAVNSRLLDCSDAHTWSSSTEKDRLGNAFTWINADPTFKGLRQAVREYEHRVSVDKRPHLLVRQAQQPDTLMRGVEVRQLQSTTVVPTFDVNLPLNPGFVAIVGNKGQGKSALMDAIALAANSDRQDEFSFLNPRRFLRDGGTSAALIDTSLHWADGAATTRQLNEKHDPRLPSQVDYLPQSLIERVCAADPDSLEKRQFEAEIERVVFRHIGEDERGDATSLRMYLGTKTMDINRQIDDARGALRLAAESVVALESRQAELVEIGLEARHLVLSTQIAELDTDIRRHQAELDAAQLARGEQGAQLTTDLGHARTLLANLETQRQSALAAVNSQSLLVSNATEIAARLNAALTNARAAARELSQLISVQQADAITIVVEDAGSQEWLVAQRQEYLLLQTRVSGTGGYDEQLENVAAEVARLENSLSEQDEGTATAMQALKDAQT